MVASSRAPVLIPIVRCSDFAWRRKGELLPRMSKGEVCGRDGGQTFRNQHATTVVWISWLLTGPKIRVSRGPSSPTGHDRRDTSCAKTAISVYCRDERYTCGNLLGGNML